MKKLVLMISAVCLAVGVHAATVSWQIKNVYDATGTTKLSGGLVYLFATQGTSADTAAITALANAGVDAVTTAMGGATLSYTMDASVAAGEYSYVAANGMTLKTNQELGFVGATTYTLFAVVFDSDTITDESKFFVTAARSAEIYADTSTANKAFSLTASGSSNPDNWKSVSDVPEPTSGLLLLVGGALLALRRKQK